MSGLVGGMARPMAIIVPLGVLVWALPLLGEKESGRAAGKPAPKVVAVASAAVPMEIRFTDDSLLKVVVTEPKIEVQTRYGKLQIPCGDIQRVDFGRRVPADVRKRIEKCISELADETFQVREDATAALLALKEQAYPALVQAAKGKNPEATRRAKKLLEQIRAQVSGELLDRPDFDVIYTEESKFAGKVLQESIDIQTMPFGDQKAKLKDILHLRLPGLEKENSGDALMDPGNMLPYQAQVGKKLKFTVTGAAVAGIRGGVWGTKVYTVDSSLALAAVHAGVLKAGQTGVVHVTILGQQANFVGSFQNGVQSNGYTAMAGYRIETGNKGKRR
jgi:hypothetical protein